MARKGSPADTRLGAHAGDPPLRIALQRKEAAAALGVSGDTFDRHIRPHLRCVFIGDIRLWPVAEIEEWLKREAVSLGLEGPDA